MEAKASSCELDLQKRVCPFCGKTENQTWCGFNRSGTRRCYCKDCNKKYTINSKSRICSEELRKQAIKLYYSGVSGRGVGKILNINKSNVVRWIKKNSKTEN
jgi:transposase-like protein